MSVTTMIPGSPERAEMLQHAVKGRSLWDDARRRLFRNKAAVITRNSVGIAISRRRPM